MDTLAVRSMLKRHAAQGAEFLSFFLEPRWQGKLVARNHNLFSLDPDNAQFGSDSLYQSMQKSHDPIAAIAVNPHRSVQASTSA